MFATEQKRADPPKGHCTKGINNKILVPFKDSSHVKRQKTVKITRAKGKDRKSRRRSDDLRPRSMTAHQSAAILNGGTRFLK